jgi:hypothetical protein
MLWALIPVAGTIALFSFLAVVVYSQERRRERETYYQHEFRRSMVESGKMTVADIKELQRLETTQSTQERRQGLMAGGLITAGAGVGILIGLRFIEDAAVWMVGYIPLLVGAGMLLCAFLISPRGDSGTAS